MTTQVFQNQFEKVRVNIGQLTVRFVIAAVLLVAAFLKFRHLLTVPILGNSFFDARWLNIVAVELELALGIWLLSALLPKLAWTVTVVLFSLWALISFYKAAVLHEVSCGCFGAVSIFPVMTMGIDLAIVAMLFIVRPKEKIFDWNAFYKELMGLKQSSKKVAVYVIVWLVAAIPVTSMMATTDFVVLSEDVKLSGNEKSVTLEPSKWLGKEFPLLDDVVWDDEKIISSELKQGDWSVLLYHVDCQECQKILAELEKQSHDKSFEKLVLIEIPRKERSLRNSQLTQNYGKSGRLRDNTEWFVQTPLLLKIRNGMVSNVDTKNVVLLITNESLENLR
jgi:hypothetical protein